MNTAQDRYKKLEEIAYMICEHPESKDGYHIDRAHDELFDLVQTIRRDQRRFADEVRTVAARAARDEWSVRVPRLELVKGDEAG